jgi:pimeloyl-ACP methyl ester carboxylesterase
MGVTEPYQEPDVHTANVLSRMEPISFEGCFGWFHSADGDVGVVLCSGIGLDARVAHQFYLELANRLAASGYPTLRFDYLGTGDALDPDDHNPVYAWRRSVQEAVTWLQATTGKSRIILCGMRLGAILATLEADHAPGVEALILLAPVISGRSYARELTFASRMHGDLSREREPGWLETDDLRIPDDALETLQSLDLRKTRSFPPQTLLLTSATNAETEELKLQFKASRTKLSSELFEDYAQITQSLSEDEVPTQSIHRIVSWLEQSVPLKTKDISSYHFSPSEVCTLNWVETPLRFGPDGGLFGVLCQPSRIVARSSLVMVIVNTGIDPHYGPGRFSVMLARDMAKVGIASLRIDFHGLGDSCSIIGQFNKSFYDLDRTNDIISAIDKLQSLGFTQFGVLGVCSGAFHAFHAALSEVRITFLVSVNQSFFRWRKGDKLEDHMASNPKSLYFYWGRVKDSDFWMRLLKRQLSIMDVVHKMRRKLLRPLKIFFAPLLSRSTWLNSDTFPKEAMNSLSKRGVKSLFLLSAKDSTFSALEDHFGQGGRGLSKFRHMSVQTILSSDHSLSRRTMREEASSLIIKHFREFLPEQKTLHTTQN